MEVIYSAKNLSISSIPPATSQSMETMVREGGVVKTCESVRAHYSCIHTHSC